MSWSVYGAVEEGDTHLLEEEYAHNKTVNDSFSNNYNFDTDEQFEFCLTVVKEAFESGIVDGAYSVSVSGHSDPNDENDRKSISIAFSPVYGANPVEV